MKSRLMVGMVLMAALGLVGCSEIDQATKSDKIYASKKDTRAYESEKFKGDKQKWESALAERNKAQNDYLRTDTK